MKFFSKAESPVPPKRMEMATNNSEVEQVTRHIEKKFPDHFDQITQLRANLSSVASVDRTRDDEVLVEKVLSGITDPDDRELVEKYIRGNS